MAARRGLRTTSPREPCPLARAHPPAPNPRLTDPSPSSQAWRNRAVYFSYRAAAAAAGAVPEAVGAGVARTLADVALPLLGHRRRTVAQHARRVRGGPINLAEERGAVRAAFRSYARYWMESLRLPAMSPDEVDARFSIDGLEHIRAGLEQGRGVVLALPHVGGWEVGGSWLVRQGIPLTVVVESLQPPELFQWFVGLRESFGLTVIPLGAGAGTQVLRTLRGNGVVALLSDRDIGGRGVEVEFFGERTTLPGGPATLALRAGAPVLPTAVYFSGLGHHAVVQPPVTIARTGRLRDDVAALTQAIARQLEELIRAAPDQWHLFQPNWPSDLL